MNTHTQVHSTIGEKTTPSLAAPGTGWLPEEDDDDEANYDDDEEPLGVVVAARLPTWKFRREGGSCDAIACLILRSRVRVEND